VRQYIIRRLIQSVFILFVLSWLVFILLRLAPGDPAIVKCGLNCPEETYQKIRDDLGLDDSWPEQYWLWGKSLLNGSLGEDYNQEPVGPELQQRLPFTVELLIVTFLVTVAIGVPFGIISAIYRNSPADYFVRLGAILGLAVPAFWVATMVLLVPQATWNYAPPLTKTIPFLTDPWDNMRQFIPPAFVLGAVSAAGVMRLTRSSMLEVMRQDYIRTARSKGLRDQVVIGRHALKNSVIPVVTVLGLELAGLFGGSVIIENVFNIQGIGNYFLAALVRKDYPVVQTLTLYIGTVVVLLNLAVDVLYAWLDPRIRYS
jgi:peptide/nickel transport system permease protein